MDKVQKIRKELERLREQLQDKVENSDFIAGEVFIMNYFLTFIDSLQEGSVSIDFEQELYKAFGQVKDFTLCMRIAKWFYDMGKNSQEPVSKDTMTIRKEWFEHCKKSWYNEGYIDGEYNRDRQFEDSVSEDLEKAAVEAFKQIVDDERNSFLEIFKAGAQWQKTMLMTNAIDVTVHIDSGGYPYIPQMELYDYDKDVPLAKEGDKYKVILIKEE